MSFGSGWADGLEFVGEQPFVESMPHVALLVEDSAVTRMQLSRALEACGLEVVTADSAEAALELIASGLKPDLVLTDHNLGGLTGAELVEGLRTRPGMGQRPLLLMSATLDPGFVQEARRVQATGVLQKPIPRAQLEALVATVLDSGE